MLCLAFIFARRSMEMQNMSGHDIKECLTEASLGWKCFRKKYKDLEFLTFNYKNVRDFNRELVKSGRVSALNT